MCYVFMYIYIYVIICTVRMCASFSYAPCLRTVLNDLIWARCSIRVSAECTFSGKHASVCGRASLILRSSSSRRLVISFTSVSLSYSWGGGATNIRYSEMYVWFRTCRGFDFVHVCVYEGLVSCVRVRGGCCCSRCSRWRRELVDSAATPSGCLGGLHVGKE